MSLSNGFDFKIGEAAPTGNAVASGVGSKAGQLRADDNGRILRRCLAAEGQVLHGQAVVIKNALAAEAPGHMAASNVGSGVQQVIVGIADLSLEADELAEAGEEFWAVVHGEAAGKTRGETIVVGDELTVDGSGFLAELATDQPYGSGVQIVGKALSANADYGVDTPASGLSVWVNGLM